MIRKKDFDELRKKVENAVNEAFEYAKTKGKNNYILFLSRSQYNDFIRKIDDTTDERDDKDRIDFLLEYVKNKYSFKIEKSEDSKFSLTIELMIYTHIWESSHNLKRLKRLADLCDTKDYSWNIEIENSRYKFIRDNIKNVFKKHKLDIFELIDKSYVSQLRNAFAHSLYHFDDNYIFFENYVEGTHNNKEKITFDEWTEIFLTSVLLHYNCNNIFFSERESLEDGKEYEIEFKYEEEIKTAIISYNKEQNRFNHKIV